MPVRELESQRHGTWVSCLMHIITGDCTRKQVHSLGCAAGVHAAPTPPGGPAAIGGTQLAQGSSLAAAVASSARPPAAVIGSGVLYLPFYFSVLGWVGGIIMVRRAATAACSSRAAGA